MQDKMLQKQSEAFHDQTVLFQTIQFSVSHLFAQSFNVIQFFLIYG